MSKRIGILVPLSYYNRESIAGCLIKTWANLIYFDRAQILIALTLEIENIHNNPAEPSFEDFQARFFASCSPYINDQSRALRLWSPDFIAFATPLVTYALLGPAATHAYRPSRNGAADQDAPRLLESEILRLILQRFSYYWPLGSVIHSEYYDPITNSETI
jgi:hypothetical protein